MEPVFFVAGVMCGVALLYFWPSIQNAFVAEEKGLETEVKDKIKKVL
jgi:hypothetical protein